MQSNKKTICRVYNYNLSGFDNVRRPLDQLSVNFNSLDKIRNFQQFVFDRYKLKIDMSVIESKENYNFVTKLTKIILFFLIMLSVISVILYVTNILILHLEKIKKNIGTFKAFGLTNRTIKFIYAQMINEFIVLAIVLSYITSLILGKIGFIKLLLLIFSVKLEKGQGYFELINNQYALISILLIFIFSVIAIVFRLSTLLNKTPGDLIYDRD
jgi:ABC-type lipoprotein release transport system permease subunit